tara:strand:+ start:468 stop:653 length:186 start_codon:yes stop_codon:yes gene_type:complete
MSFVDWMNMNMIVDIAFLVFSVAVVWKFNKTKQKIESLEKDLNLVMVNPTQARRVLKKRLK